MRHPIAGLLAALLASSATAAPPFQLPAACILGEDCWVVRHVDRGPGPQAQDVGCGQLTADGHGGTDLAVADLARLAEGVAIVAPAAGRIEGVRDGMVDGSLDDPSAPAVDGRQCGNGVRIQHAEGWTSQLCHLRRGGILVTNGDIVRAGQQVGWMGLSGETTFPHVHWSLWHRDRPVDPFDGADVAQGAACGGDGPSLIEGGTGYAPLPLVGVGFAANAPNDDDILRGWHRESALPTSAPALILWMHAYGTQAGDVLRFTVTGPTGPVVERTMDLDRGHARGSYYVGAKRPEGHWPPGNYTGTVTWTRADTQVQRTARIAIEP